MNRGKKVIIFSHCILNQNSVITPYAREFNEFKELISSIIEKNIGIIQLPCPELTMYGLKRWGHVKDQFENPHFIKQSRDLLQNTIENLLEYKNSGYEIIGVVGIKESPSCGVSKSCRGDYGGSLSCKNLNTNIDSYRAVDESGVFMEVLEYLAKEEGIELNFYDDLDYVLYKLELSI